MLEYENIEKMFENSIQIQCNINFFNRIRGSRPCTVYAES